MFCGEQGPGPHPTALGGRTRSTISGVLQFLYLVANGIEKIEEVELKFHIYDVTTYETIADSEVIKFSAQ